MSHVCIRIRIWLSPAKIAIVDSAPPERGVDPEYVRAFDPNGDPWA